MLSSNCIYNMDIVCFNILALIYQNTCRWWDRGNFKISHLHTSVTLKTYLLFRKVIWKDSQQNWCSVALDSWSPWLYREMSLFRLGTSEFALFWQAISTVMLAWSPVLQCLLEGPLRNPDPGSHSFPNWPQAVALQWLTDVCWHLPLLPSNSG